jgi:taurine-pyruvate aminotransferase
LTQHQNHHPLVIERGVGSRVYDTSGREYLDAAAGLWCVNVGYSRQELIDAAIQQLSTLPYYPLTQSHPAALALGERLAGLLPHVPHVYFSNSGSEANEVAFKMVRQYWQQVGKPGKVKIISRHRGYHGSTLGALSATGQPERKRGYEPLAPGFIQVAAPYCYRCPFEMDNPKAPHACALDFERRIQIEGPETVAAIIVEPVVAGGGAIVPPETYLAQVADIARRYDVKLIVDEVVTGFGRVGDMFAHQGYGVLPDIVTMAKGIASGYVPIGATAVSEEIFQAFLGDIDSGRHFRHVNTYGGHPVAAAVSLANIDVIENEALSAHSRRQGERLLKLFQDSLIDEPHVGDIRGRGLLIGIELVQDRADKTPVKNHTMRSMAGYLLEHGILAGKSTDVDADQNNVLIFAPPLIITDEECEHVADIVASGLRHIGAAAAIP